MRHAPRLLLLALVALLAACSNPLDTPVPKDLGGLEAIKPAIEKLKPEERELFTGYMLRHTVGAAMGKAFGVAAEPIPDGMTVGKAIEDQRGFVAKQKAEAEAKKMAQEKAEAERKALIAQMATVLAVRLSDLSLHRATYRDMDVKSRIDLTFEFENKGTKDISGVKGRATFKDKFGDLISASSLKVEDVLPAGKTTTVRLSRNFNQFDNEDRLLANADAGSITFELAPEVVLFADGTKFEAPKSAKE